MRQMEEFKAKEAKSRLMDANRLAIAGGREEAEGLLDAILTSEPDMEDAWMLKAHLAETFDEKIRCFERVLEINEENTVARANLESLKVFVNSAPEIVEEEPDVVTEPDLSEPEAELSPENGKWDGDEEFEAVMEAEEAASEPEPEEEAGAVSMEFVEEEVPALEAASEELEVPEPVEDPSSEPEFEAISQPESFEELEAEETRDFVPVEEDEFLGTEPVAHNDESCPFCGSDVESQGFVCGGCNAVISLSDIEMLLSASGTDADVLDDFVKNMESEHSVRGVETEELRTLGIAYINAKQFRKGFEYLEEFAGKNPGDVVLRSQLDALAVRVSEIEAQQSEKEALPKSKTILIVDDSPTIRKLISLKLQKCGHETICAVDGVDALEKINEVVPDLVLLDITMPRMDGYQTCKQIRGNDATKDVPVVMISGKDGFFDKVRGKMAGTTNYITKPFGPETLMRTVNEYLM